MKQQLETITEWLDGCKGHTLHIQKQEDNDRDLTLIQLENVTITHDVSDRGDDYIAENELILHGSGYVYNTDDGNHPALPQNQYEIPLLRGWRGDMTQGTLRLVTDRGTYLIQRQEDLSVH
jgi:hypothetical protein